MTRLSVTGRVSCAAIAIVLSGTATAGAAVVANQGPPTAGKQCVLGGRDNKSASLGLPLDGLPDTRGKHGNEVSEIFSIVEIPAGAAGAASHLGFLTTTFNHEWFYQFPVTSPGTNAPVILNVGTITIRPNAEMPAVVWFRIVDRAIALGRSRSGATNGAYEAARRFQAQVKRSGTVTIVPCFDGPWDGRAN